MYNDVYFKNLYKTHSGENQFSKGAQASVVKSVSTSKPSRTHSTHTLKESYLGLLLLLVVVAIVSIISIVVVVALLLVAPLYVSTVVVVVLSVRSRGRSRRLAGNRMNQRVTNRLKFLRLAWI